MIMSWVLIAIWFIAFLLALYYITMQVQLLDKYKHVYAKLLASGEDTYPWHLIINKSKSLILAWCLISMYCVFSIVLLVVKL